MPRNYIKKNKTYHEVGLINACLEVDEGSSIINVSKKYKICFGNLRRESGCKQEADMQTLRLRL